MSVKNFLISTISIIILVSAPAGAAFKIPSKADIEGLLKKGGTLFCDRACNRLSCKGEFFLARDDSAGKRIYALCGVLCPPKKVERCVTAGKRKYGMAAGNTAIALLGTKGIGKDRICQYGCSAPTCGKLPNLGNACVASCRAGQVQKCKAAIPQVVGKKITVAPTEQQKVFTRTIVQEAEKARKKALEQQKLSKPLGAGEAP